MKYYKSPRSGFTLIELLTVIAIIGILAAILIPAVGAVRIKAAQAQSQSNLKQIALAYNSFSISGSRTRIISSGAWAAGTFNASSPAEWAQVLAEFGDLNDGELYFITSDTAVASVSQIPKIIITEDSAGDAEVTPAWTAASNAISYEMAAGLSPNSQASITPLIWTRGHDGTGDWEADSPWDGKGGHIAFLDGHVVYYESTEGELVDIASGEPTGDISAAMNDSAEVLALSE